MEIKGQQRKRTAEEAFRQPNGPNQPRWKGTNANRLPKVVTFGPQEDHDLGRLQTSSSMQAKLIPATEAKSHLKQRASLLLKTRQQLPVWTHADEIRSKVKANDVLLLVGETGSGKSTQIPQFLLSQCQQKMTKNGAKVGGCIAITQPRRVAAISLARRVAEEVGTPLGKSSPASQVGYLVRFDSNTSPSTKIKFVTDGMLLQELVRDPWLKEYSIIVVDEVHERGVNVDLLLGFLKQMIDRRDKSDGRGGLPLKVVIMSATADMEKIQTFFGQDRVGVLKSAPNSDTNGSLHQQAANGHQSSSKGSNAVDQQTQSTKISAKLASCHIKGRQYPVKMHYSPIPAANVLDEALERIINIHAHTPLPGDILVFLPGQETIATLESMCTNYAQSLLAKSKEKGAPKLPRLLVLPLFAALPTDAQQRVFETTPPFTRKIILSTNIAETSVTVPGIRHVIDTGKRKARVFRPGLNLETLLTTRISRSSANQRAGRAGREAPGNCYRLYTEKTFYELEADTEPEILRCDLSQLVLILKSHNVENPLAFPLLTPLPMKSLERALLHLLRLKALDRQTGQITTLGKQMSTLPVPANLARILLASQSPQYNCLEEIIDIISGLSVENIWLPIHNTISRVKPDIFPIHSSNNATQPSLASTSNDNEGPASASDDENPTAQARSTFFRREGDHLTLLAAIQSYTSENTDRKDFCRTHGLNHRAMKSAMDIRKQLRNLFIEGKKYAPAPGAEQDPNTKTATQTSDDLNTRILRTLLLGLSDKVAILSHSPAQTQTRDGSESKGSREDKKSIWTGPYATLSSTSRHLQVHPSSVLFRPAPGAKPACIMFSEFVVTERAYARCVSVIESAWLDEIDQLGPLA